MGSERAYQCLTESLQTFGGSGFLQDYPIEQYIRDAKIDSLYEGTTAIQAQDFFFRKIVRDQGEALGHVVRPDRGVPRRATAPRPELADARALLATALDDVQAMVTTHDRLSDRFPAEPARTLPGGPGVGALPARRRRPADRLAAASAGRDRHRALDGDPTKNDADFYHGKVAAATFFAKNVLPRLAAERKIVESTDLAIMDVAEEAF